MCYRLPFTVSCITLTAYCLLSWHIVSTLLSLTDTKSIVRTSTKYAWIFAIHYIPFVVQASWNMIFLHLFGFLCLWAVFAFDLVKPILRVLGLKYFNASNAIMHCGIIFNNYIAYKITN